ncbi:MAG: NYN domain-containing protein [Acidobacteriota bacterium]|nr:NYN domain-containing protein [Acidobacteriota bacterium]
MSSRPPVKRAAVFIDGQNLFHAAREAFGYTYPNFDVTALAKRLCAGQGWKLAQVRFYTGIPDAGDNARWHFFWTHKLAAMGRQGVVVYSRSLRYRNRTVSLPDGTQHSLLTGEEKGIDVRIALDVIALAHRREYDVAIVLSQDQISQIKIASAFPQSPASRNRRGIDKTDWIRIDRTLYDQCLDPRDYRRKL